MTAAHNNIFIRTIGALRIDVVKKCVDKPGTESVMMGSDLSYYSIKVDAGRWNVRKYLRIINRWTFWEPHGVNDPGFRYAQIQSIGRMLKSSIAFNYKMMFI